MKKHKIIALVVATAIVVLLAGCQSKPEQTAYEIYTGSYRAESFLKNNPEYLYHDTIYAEALAVAYDEELSLAERYKAVDLLCEGEYQQAKEENEISRDDFLYPLYGPVAAQVFSAVEADDNSEFWEVLDDASGTKELLNAAAPYFSADTVLRLYEDRNKADDYTAMFLSDHIARALRENNANLYELAEAMFENGYFSKDSHYSALDVFVKGGNAANTVEEGLAYITFFRETALPLLETNYPGSTHAWRTNTRGEETSYYNPGLRITLNADTIDTSHIQTAGIETAAAVPMGKVLALIENGSQDEYPEVGTTFVLDGDFLLNLPAERMPATLDEVDYLVSITSIYENVGEYGTDGKSVNEQNPIYAIASYSHIAVNNWHTGERTGYYGTVESDAPSMIVVVNNNRDGKREYAFAPHPAGKDVYQTVEAYL